MDDGVSIARTRVLLDDYFRVEEVLLRHERADGRMSDEVRRLNLERGDSAAALVVNRDRRACILTRQFRYSAYKRGERWCVEVPAGVVEDAEDPVEAIRRELLEEIGYRAGELEPIATFFTSPGGSSERVHLFVAVVRDRDRIGPGGGLEAENESIEVLEIALDDVDAFLLDAEVGDAKTIIALNWLQLRAARCEPLWDDDHE
jgi:ADP-ribose pyrophosphatase